MLKKIISLILIILHLSTFGPICDALAFSSKSTNFILASDTVNEGGPGDAVATSSKLRQEAIGDSSIGLSQSPNYKLSAGYIPTVQPAPPALSKDIPYQAWPMNSSKTDAFDLDSYFSNPEGYPITYKVTGNSKINISINPQTHTVSFSQPKSWYGAEKVYFSATDTQGNSILSNKVVLHVQHPDSKNSPVVLSTKLTPSIVKEGDLITLFVKATDPDANDTLTFTYSNYFTQTRSYKEEGFWFSEATFQLGANSKGHYPVTITVKDSKANIETESLVINVGNFNHPPIVTVSDITYSEGDLAIISLKVTDEDNDSVIFYYSAPFDLAGSWRTGFNDAGAYSITVIASDSIDTMFIPVEVTILNTNQSPQITLNLSKTTLEPNQTLDITIIPDDPDKDDPAYKEDSLKCEVLKDSTVIYSGTLIPGLSYPVQTTFANEGYYKITAKVIDSLGKEASVTKDVHITLPRPNQPLMGDFNGDGLTDLGVHDTTTGNWEVAVSKQGNFEGAVRWLSGFGNSSDWLTLGGDFNGDTRTDIAIYNTQTGELKVATSTSLGFIEQGTWLTVSPADFNLLAFTGNFNADKYTDFALYNRNTGEVKVALGNGSGLQGFSVWLAASSPNTEYTSLTGDFNADSLTDLCLFKKTTGEFKVFPSSTEQFVDGSSWISGFATDKDPIIADFDQDGLTDIGYWDKTNFNIYYAVSTGEGFIEKGLYLENFGASQYDLATTLDFSGDGLTDVALFDVEGLGISRFKLYQNTNQPSDLLTNINNGIGGKTKVEYTYVKEPNNINLPFPVYVAAKIALVDTLPEDQPEESYSQVFQFSGGYYDAGEREFRGFEKVTATDTVTKNFTETYFYQGKPGQNGGLKGQIREVFSRDGNNGKISRIENTYVVRKGGSDDKFLGFPSLTEQKTTAWEENGTSIVTTAKFTYDSIGNVIEQKEGEVDLTASGIEQAKYGLILKNAGKTTTTVFAPAYDYIADTESGFNRPLEASLKDKDGNIISKKTFEYDSGGNPLKESSLLYNPLTQNSQFISQSYAYDPSGTGNLISTTNAKGATVTTEYEKVFYTYPEKATNSLGHTLIYEYEPKFGAVTKVTDANGVSSSTEYDSLGRTLRGTRDDGEGTQVTVVTYAYPDFNTKITSNAVGLSVTEYIDGLARKYKTISSGEDGVNKRNVSTEVFFNPRGLTEKESLPHYVDEEDPNQISYVRYEYDIRGRLKKTISDSPGTLKDTEASVSYINPLYTETTDPEQHRSGSLKDIYGNIIEVREFVHQDDEAKPDGAFHTYYEYDAQNNLTKTTDNKNNITQIWYDSLGRKLKMSDPDMGTWSYEYDLLGNLKKQTDAKKQVLEFEYDALNRLTKKWGLIPSQGSVPIFSVEYFYDDPDKPNCIGRLSKVSDQSGSTEFFYDELGREVESIKSLRRDLSLRGAAAGSDEAISYTVQREYDILDRLTSLKYPDGEVVNYAYDSNSGLLEKVFTKDEGGGTRDDYVKDITYNAKGQIKAVSYGNNIKTEYTHGQDLRLSRILTKHELRGTALQDLSYTFDKNGNITTLKDNLRSNTRTFSYDELDRLITAENSPDPNGGYTTFAYEYNSIGNMTRKSDIGDMSYGQNAGPHALTSAGGYTYIYDANGSMTQGKNKTLEYDAENRLTKVTEAGIITLFSYDGDGGRVRKMTDGGRRTKEETTYIGSLFEIDSSGKTTKHIFSGANRIATITLRASATEGGASREDTAYYHSDHLGSSSVITDKDGNQVQHLEYTPYGTIAINEGTDVAKHKFTGKELDNTGLYFYGARYYDPEIGRFVTADPTIQRPYDPQDLNRYTYCRNNPINYIDPSGLGWKKFWKKFGSSVLQIVGVLAVPFTGGASLYLTYAGLAWSSVQAAQAGQFGAFAAGLVAGIVTAGIASAFVAPAMAGFLGGGQALTAFQGALITGTEFGMAGAAAGFVGTLAGGGSLGQAGMAAGIGFGAGAAMGGAIGYTYAAGIQDVLHGFDTRGYNQNIFLNQIGQGNYAGASQTLSTDSVLRLRVSGAKVHFSNAEGVQGIMSSNTILAKSGTAYLADLLPGKDNPAFTVRTLGLSSSDKGNYFIGLNAKNLSLTANLKTDPIGGWTRFEYLHAGNINLSNTQVYGSYSNDPAGHSAYIRDVLAK